MQVLFFLGRSDSQILMGFLKFFISMGVLVSALGNACVSQWLLVNTVM